MAFNIDEFISNGLRHGGARPTLFNVEVIFPTGLAGVSSSVSQKLFFTCRATSIPASTIAPVSIPYFGREVKVAGDRTFADWSVTVMNDEDYTVRNSFEAWHNNINSIVSNRRAVADSPSAGYKGTALVTHYSKTGPDAVIKSYRIVNLFPIAVDEMALDWDATNQIQTFGVTFSYDYWEPLVNNVGLEGGPVSPTIDVNL